MRGSRTTDNTARHVMAACDQAVGVVLASTDVDGKTNEITRFAPLLDQIGDLRDTVITADALHCQREHVDYLAERGAHWILTVKGNQPSLHTKLAGLPWRAVPDATRDTDCGHGRREIRTLKALTISTGIDFPHAAQALQIRRRRRRLDQPKRFTTEAVYAITDLRVHQAKPAQGGHDSLRRSTRRRNLDDLRTSHARLAAINNGASTPVHSSQTPSRLCRGTGRSTAAAGAGYRRQGATAVHRVLTF
nr:ISAs1 family transposase [Micromonospora sp. KC606]